jgi:hypothetical protein
LDLGNHRQPQETPVLKTASTILGLRGIVVCATVAVALPGTLSAQIRASEAGAVSQTLDGTTIAIEYSRPTARGRDLFGGIVPWNVVWTPGANWATTFEADRDVRLNGVEVPAGKYSVWMIPRPDQWTLTLNPSPEIFHFVKPDSTADQIHIAVTPEEGEHVEMLTWSFPAVSGDAAVVAMSWGTISVPVQVLVEPTRPLAIDPDERQIYLGTYDLEILPGIGWPTEARLTVSERDGKLVARLPFPLHPGDELEFDLVPAGTLRFNPGLYRGGELFNIEMGVAFEFEAPEDEAIAIVMRGIEGTPFATGTRSGSR